MFVYSCCFDKETTEKQNTQHISRSATSRAPFSYALSLLFFFSSFCYICIYVCQCKRGGREGGAMESAPVLPPVSRVCFSFSFGGGGLMENRFEELKPKALPFSAIVFLFAVSCGDYCVYGDC